jgi:hypothetical protein
LNEILPLQASGIIRQSCEAQMDLRRGLTLPLKMIDWPNLVAGFGGIPVKVPVCGVSH